MKTNNVLTLCHRTKRAYNVNTGAFAKNNHCAHNAQQHANMTNHRANKAAEQHRHKHKQQQRVVDKCTQRRSCNVLLRHSKVMLAHKRLNHGCSVKLFLAVSRCNINMLSNVVKVGACGCHIVFLFNCAYNSVSCSIRLYMYICRWHSSITWQYNGLYHNYSSKFARINAVATACTLLHPARPQPPGAAVRSKHSVRSPCNRGTMPHNTASNSRSNTTSSATHAQAQLDGQQATTRKTVRTRLVELGYYFMNAQGAIPTADIYAKFYPNTPSLMACEKAFSRDRKALEEFGFSIEQIKEGNYNYYWRVNQSKSFLSQSITALQAQYLITLLQPLVDDPSFARGVDLHYALMRLASISTNAHQALAACVPTSDAAGSDGSEGNTSTASHSDTANQSSTTSSANKSRKTGEQTLRAREKQLINTRMLEVVTDAQRTKHLVDATYTTSDGTTKKTCLQSSACLACIRTCTYQQKNTTIHSKPIHRVAPFPRAPFARFV